MKTVKTHRLSRRSIAVTDDIDWKVFIGSPSCLSDPIRVRLRAWTMNYMPPPDLALGSPANGDIDILIDGTTFKTGLGTGAEEKIVDELITDKMPAGEHTITVHHTGTDPHDIEMELEEWQ